MKINFYMVILWLLFGALLAWFYITVMGPQLEVCKHLKGDNFEVKKVEDLNGYKGHWVDLEIEYGHDVDVKESPILLPKKNYAVARLDDHEDFIFIITSDVAHKILADCNIVEKANEASPILDGLLRNSYKVSGYVLELTAEQKQSLRDARDAALENDETKWISEELKTDYDVALQVLDKDEEDQRKIALLGITFFIALVFVLLTRSVIRNIYLTFTYHERG